MNKKNAMTDIPVRAMAIALGLFVATAVHAGDNGTAANLWQAISGGKLSLNLRYRFEHVGDDLSPGGVPLRDANASTLRTTLAYTSGEFLHLSARLEGEQVSRIFSGHFNEGTGQTSRYATVVDPDGTELNQGYLRFTGLPHTDLRAGRQVITYRDAPLHRFIGNVLWRQNWQTFDAVSLSNTSLPDTRISYAWVRDVNRIFGDSAPEPLSRFRGSSHFFNVRNTAISHLAIEFHAYLLDFDNAARFSSQTWGLRLSGGYPAAPQVSLLYAAEYSRQSGYGNHPGRYNADYQLLEGGVAYKTGKLIDSLVLKADFERLSGDGSPNGAFVTILGTNHAFQGWADRFLVTPNDGIRDYYATAIVTALGARLMLVYHLLQADHMGYQYGREFDVDLSRKFGKHFTAGAKYAGYNADANAANLARNGAQAADTTKFWFYCMLRF